MVADLIFRFRVSCIKECSSRHSSSALAGQGYINGRTSASSDRQRPPLLRSPSFTSVSPAPRQQFAWGASPAAYYPTRPLRWLLPINSSTRSTTHTHARLMPLRSFTAGFYFFGIAPTSSGSPKNHHARRVSFRLRRRLSGLAYHLAGAY